MTDSKKLDELWKKYPTEDELAKAYLRLLDKYEKLKKKVGKNEKRKILCL